MFNLSLIKIVTIKSIIIFISCDKYLLLTIEHILMPKDMHILTDPVSWLELLWIQSKYNQFSRMS